jgi:hypothetical protein
MRAALWRATRTLRVSRVAHQPLSCVCDASKQRRHLHHSQMAGPRGAFIVLEGTDRSGKSTQCARLVTALNASGVPAELWRFPDRTTSVGHMLDAYLRGTPEGDADDAAVHLLFSANRWEKRCVRCRGGGGVQHSHLTSFPNPLRCQRTRLLEALQAGTTLVVDRYAYSGVAFTSAKRVQGLGLDWCKVRRKCWGSAEHALTLQRAWCHNRRLMRACRRRTRCCCSG